MRCLMRLFCIGFCSCRDPDRVLCIWHRGFLPAACQRAHPSFFTCFWVWLVTNNCKIIPPVPIKQDLQWKNSQPLNEAVVSWCLIRPFTQTKHLFVKKLSADSLYSIWFNYICNLWGCFKVSLNGWTWLALSEMCELDLPPHHWISEAWAEPGICFKLGCSQVWAVLYMWHCGNKMVMPVPPVIVSCICSPHLGCAGLSG